MRKFSLRLLIFFSLAAFVAVGVMAVLPHSHAGEMIGHHCLFCRAQSIQPDTAPETVSITSLTLSEEPVLARIPTLPLELFAGSLHSRAPPTSTT